MAIDPIAFPFVRESFQPPGQRHFAYIGNSRPEKGTHILAEIFRRSSYTLHAYGYLAGEICNLPNVHYHGVTHTTPEFGRDLCKIATAFLNTSISDANPTTLLETAAWGFLVACTPQSGYYGPTNPFWGLNNDDINSDLWLLQHINEIPEETLWERVRSQRAAIEAHYTWQRFCETISNHLTSDVTSLSTPTQGPQAISKVET